MSSPEQSTSTRRVRRYRDADAVDIDDALVVEEPLEIRVGDTRFTVTMRTPGADFDLVRGLLFTEGLINTADDIGQIRYCDAGEVADTEYDNVVTVRLKTTVDIARGWQRNLMSGTSCGLCGKAALEAVTAVAPPIDETSPIDRAVLASLPDVMRRQQPIFDRTGGLHAAAIFDSAATCLALFEDIGRHNAVDKAIGRVLLYAGQPSTSPIVGQASLPVEGDSPSLAPSPFQGEGRGEVSSGGSPPLNSTFQISHSKFSAPLVLLVSGRASFEITQKALIAGIPIVASVSAASTLAVDLAAASNMTLIGFLRGSGLTVYTGQERIRN